MFAESGTQLRLPDPPNPILEDYRLSTSQSTSDWPLWQSIENKEPCGWLLDLPGDDLVGAPFLLGLTGSCAFIRKVVRLQLYMVGRLGG